MLYLLINMSIIWLLSLLVYGLLLQRETFHHLNRSYLLITFVMGVALPLLPWQQQVVLPEVNHVYTSLQERIAAHSDLPARVRPLFPAASSSFPVWQLLYLAGAVFSLLLLVREHVRLWQYYKQGIKHREEDWTIIATGKNHQPFSIGKLLFVHSRVPYDSRQWQIIRQHELAHQQHYHMLDLILVQTAAILLWFHPLVYYYRRKIRLVHEYEADAAQGEMDRHSYGHFLIEQSVSVAGPSLSHAFSLQPLKSRILMMSRRQSLPLRYFKILLLLPLLACFLYCCSSNSTRVMAISKGDELTLSGNTISYSPRRYDTATMADPATGTPKQIVYSTTPLPEQLNGRSLELLSEDYAIFTDSKDALSEQYLLDQLKPVLPPLPDAVYQIQLSGIVINTEGRIVHYNCTGLHYNAKANGAPQNKDSRTIDAGLRRAADKQIANALLNKIIVRSSGRKIDQPVVLGYDLDLKFRMQHHHILPY